MLYSTDPGNLSPNVNHAAADALVAAAAGVWNVSVANITVSQGGSLAEHVSGANVYVDSTGLRLPADVLSANAAAIPLAVIYDTDGSVTDTLLGTGASDPTSCRQNAVTESVDAFDPAGSILHALIIVNGRCTGTATAAQLQLRYQLMRAFGRVLGLAWSQTNDNVFTGTPAPTSIQAQNWPILHPIDIVCGSYTYQCLPNPFQLRADDIAGLVAVYPLPSTPTGGPSGSAQGVNGWITFPTGQGMAGVNVLVQRQTAQVTDAFYVGSAVTGAYFRADAVSPFVSAIAGPAGSFGSSDAGQLGYYAIAYFPMLSLPWENLVVSTEPVNPLYTGEYSLGPYGAGSVAPAGSSELYTARVTTPGWPQVNHTVADAPAQCGTGGDGTLAAPMAVPATGWWTGLLCGYGHGSYAQTNLKAGRTFALEVTALDAAGLPTTLKAMPVLGWYGPQDSGIALPSLGVVANAFNGLTMGTTTLTGSTSAAGVVRFGIADERGDGRPDFNYQARLLYADSVTPAQVAATGGTATISGTGFRSGNAVYVHGVAATVTSWTANTIVLRVPSMAAVGVVSGAAVDVQVLDRTTGATSTMTGVLTYLSSASLPNAMRLVSAPASTVLVGDVAAVSFAVQVLAADGVTPVANEPVVFSTVVGTASFGACGATVCTLKTDANGMASTTVTPGQAGTVTVQAADGKLLQQAGFTALAQAGKIVVLGAPESPLRVGTASSNWFAVQVLAADGVTPMGNRPLTFSVLQGAASFAACSASVCTVTTPAWGQIGMPVTPLSVGTIVLQAADGDAKATVTLVGLSNEDTMQIVTPLPASLNLGASATLGIRLVKPDGSGDSGQTITMTAPSGVVFASTGTSTSVQTTNAGGYATDSISPSQTGTFLIQAAGAGVQQSETVVVLPALAPTLRLISAPADGSATGTPAAVPFAVQLLQADGTPFVNAMVPLEGVPGSVLLSACGRAVCQVPVDGNGIASTLVTPLVAGEISLSAAYAALTQTASFQAVGQAERMTIVSQPASAGAPVGLFEALAVKVTGPDGLTPVDWDAVTFSVLSGPFSLLGAASSQLMVHTGSDGLASVLGVATGSGTVQIQVTDGTVTQGMTFFAGAPANVMRVLSWPGTTVDGTVAAAPFTVQLFASDGVTPAAGKNVTFTVTNGAASFGACSSSICVVSTDGQGIASTTVQPMIAGTVGLLAALGTISQPASFVSVVPPDVLRLLSAPASGGYVGTLAAAPFAVQVFLPDGVTAAAGRSVTVSVTNHAGALAACSGASSCVLKSDANGVVTSAVTPLTAASVQLTAVDGAASISASFAVIPKPDLLRVTSTPAAGSYVGVSAAIPFGVQVLAGDGVTPISGKTVTISVTSGSATLGACSGASSCVLVTDVQGSATTQVTPLAAGTITLEAVDGTATASASFVAATRPDRMLLLSAPAGSVSEGLVAPQSFSVQVLAGDGTTARVSKSVTFAASEGSATFGACGAAVCTVLTDARGIASTSVTPVSAGAITLQATEDVLTVTATFTGIVLPDLLHAVQGPAAGSFTGVQASVPFSVQVLLADGVTPAAGRSVTLSVTSGSAGFVACSGNPSCVLTADALGMVSSAVTPLSEGTIKLQAADATASVSYPFTAVARPDVLTVVTGPSGSVAVNSPAAAFTVRLTLADGVTPDAGKPVVFTASQGSVLWSVCGMGACTVLTAADGTASARATPQAAGAIMLSASIGALIQSTSFTAVELPHQMRVTSVPASGSFTGSAAAAPFSVIVLKGDGVTPAAGRAVVFSVVSGKATFGACAGASTCTLVTDSAGAAGSWVTPTSAGTITLSAADGGVAQSASFTAVARPDTLRVVAAQSAPVHVGELAATAFTVLLLQGDGVTPDAGRSVVFSASGGTLSASGCSANTCTVTTGSDGTASVQTTPSAAGTVTLTAVYGAASVSASFTAIANQYQVASLTPVIYVAEGASISTSLSVQAAANGVAAAGQAVQWTGSAAIVPLEPNSVIGADGTSAVPAVVGPLDGGATGSASACVWAGVCADFSAAGVSASLFQAAIVSGGLQSVTGGAALVPVTVRISDDGGHAVAAAPVTVYQTVTALAAACPGTGRCPAAPVLLSQVTAAVANNNGQVTVEPLTIDGAATQTEFTVVAGSNGFASTVLTRQP